MTFIVLILCARYGGWVGHSKENTSSWRRPSFPKWFSMVDQDDKSTDLQYGCDQLRTVNWMMRSKRRLKTSFRNCQLTEIEKTCQLLADEIEKTRKAIANGRINDSRNCRRRSSTSKWSSRTNGQYRPHDDQRHERFNASEQNRDTLVFFDIWEFIKFSGERVIHVGVSPILWNVHASKMMSFTG